MDPHELMIGIYCAAVVAQVMSYLKERCEPPADDDMRKFIEEAEAIADHHCIARGDREIEAALLIDKKNEQQA